MKLEVVVVPVSDIDRAKAFYNDKVGFNVDVDNSPTDEFRVVQLTPPGSACSITLIKGPGTPQMEPGSLQGLQMTVPDIFAVHDELAERGVDVSEVQTFDQQAGEFRNVEGEPEPFNAFVFFNDPDGNGWALQQGPS